MNESATRRTRTTVLRGGHVVSAEAVVRADVRIADGIIAGVGVVEPEPGEEVLDCTGRYVLPGFIDTHSHVDGVIFDDDIQLSLLRQGVTTALIGQDGVSYAPGDGTYATEYFAAINGPHPHYTGGGVTSLLASYDGRVRVNLGYLLPASTIRYEVMGSQETAATPDQVDAMQQHVRAGMAQGALGVSSGLDYVPGIFATTAELTELVAPLATTGGVYVSHMRGGYEANSRVGIEEMAHIARVTGVPINVSHFHAETHIVLDLLEELAREGIDVSFDAYPYTRGCTLVSMAILPAEVVNLPVDDAVDMLRTDRERLRTQWFPHVDNKPSLGPDWRNMITLGHVPAPEYAWSAGHTLSEAAERAQKDVIDFTLDLLIACRLQVNAVMGVRYERGAGDLGPIFSHPGHLGGSDGIFVGAHPHPRAHGTFARYLREYVREESYWTWPEAAAHLSTGPASRYALGKRGRIEVGWVADLIVVDPASVTDRATYRQPNQLSTGIDDVFLAGERVLAAGRLTKKTPGGGLRRDPVSPVG